jgi:O-antigen ligase
MAVGTRVPDRSAPRSGRLSNEAALLGVAQLPAITTFAVVTAVGIAGGGFKPTVWRLSTIALLALASAALVARERIALGRREWLFLGGFAALAGWSLLTSLWSFRPSISVIESERTVLYLAGAAAVLVVVERSSLFQVVAGAVAGITLVSLVGLVEHFTWNTRSPLEGTLLYQPLGYANAVGIYATIGILLAGGLALVTRGRARLAALAPLTVLVPALSLTSSRGAWVALPIGAVAMLHFGRLVRGRVLVIVLALGIVAGLIAGSNEGQGVTIVGPNRPHYWHVALLQYEAKPFTGYGAGTFGDYFWADHRPSQGFTREAHSLYLETLAELGPVGILFLAAALFVPLVVFHKRRDPLVAATGGAYVAFLLHNAIDWDWKIPALTLVGVFCGAATLAATREADAAALSPRARAALLAAASVIAALAVFRLATGPTIGY